MRRSVRHIVNAILVLALVMCFGITIGYTNSIGKDFKTVNFYFDNESVNSSIVSRIMGDRNDISVLGWREKSLESVTNEDLNRDINNLTVLEVKGDLSLLLNDVVSFQDDKEGCLIDEETSHKLFGSTNVVGKEITYGERKLIIRGIHKGIKSNIVVPLLESDESVLDGLIIGGNDITLNILEEFKTQFEIEEIAVNGDIYYIFAKLASMILPITLLVLLLVKLSYYFFKAKRKPILKLIYITMALAIIFTFIKVTNITISIPLDMIPNKWSDFEFWSKLLNENKEKLEYVLYMKKFGIDICNIESLITSIIYSALSVVMLIINLKFFKINNINGLIYTITLSILSTFIVVLRVWYNYNFDVNVAALWLTYPLYISLKFFIDNHEKYISYEDNEIRIQHNGAEAV